MSVCRLSSVEFLSQFILILFSHSKVVPCLINWKKRSILLVLRYIHLHLTHVKQSPIFWNAISISILVYVTIHLPQMNLKAFLILPYSNSVKFFSFLMILIFNTTLYLENKIFLKLSSSFFCFNTSNQTFHFRCISWYKLLLAFISEQLPSFQIYYIFFPSFRPPYTSFLICSYLFLCNWMNSLLLFWILFKILHLQVCYNRLILRSVSQSTFHF